MKLRPGPIWKGPKPAEGKPPPTAKERHERFYTLPGGAQPRWQIWLVAGVFLAGVLMIAGIVLFNFRPHARQVRFVVRGTPGLRLKGVLNVDGRSQELEVVVPTDYLFPAHDVDFSLKRPVAGGEFSVVVFLDGKQRSVVESTTPTGGITVAMRHHLFKDSYQSAAFEAVR